MRNYPSTKQILKPINELERHINRWKMVPAVHYLRSRVILPLLSKSLTVGKAVCALIDAGYPAEAFATSRTLLALVFTVHYITNKDMEKRAERYVKYQARVEVEWRRIAQKHFPAKAAKLRPLSPHILAMAKEFKSKGNWTGEHGQAKAMAIEEDTFELDERGVGFKNEFDYDGLYFWTGQYVHATVAGIGGHTTAPGEVFKVRARKQMEKQECATDALYVTVVTLCKIFVYACRSINEKQPQAAHELYKLIRKFYGRSGLENKKRTA